MHRIHRRQSVRRRSAFTLLELIVVMGIIAALLGLTVFAAVSFVTNSREAATEVTIKKVDAMLQDRMSALELYFEEANRRATDTAGNFRILVPSYVDRSQSPDVRGIYQKLLNTRNQEALRLVSEWELVSKKFFRKKMFPMTFAEADIDNDGNTDVTDNTGAKINPAALTNHTPETESSEVLYWFLTNGPQFGNEPVGTGDFTPSELKDTDGDGLLEIVDSWGRPLRFYRWPTRLVRPQPMGMEATAVDPANVPVDVSVAGFLLGTLPPDTVLGHDPEDPLDNLRVNHLKGGLAFSATELEQFFHTMQTWHSPLIISAGEDGVLGLYDVDTDPTTDPPAEFYRKLAQPDYSQLEGLYDNFTNLKLRTGGD